MTEDKPAPAHWQRERANMQRRIRAQRKQLADLQRMYNMMLAGSGWQQLQAEIAKRRTAESELAGARSTFRQALQKLG